LAISSNFDYVIRSFSEKQSIFKNLAAGPRRINDLMFSAKNLIGLNRVWKSL